MGGGSATRRPELYKVYPAANKLIYNGTTTVHFLLGGLGIWVGYSSYDFAFLAALAYVIFAFGQMYIIMPLVVCPNCVYYRLDDGSCVSGMNRVSRKIAKEGSPDNFGNRAKGPLSHNKLYMGSLIFPIVAIAPALILEFSIPVLVLLLAVVGLMLFRFFIVFKKVACVHCLAKKKCPNAIAMGLT
jgi:hypothetical protein